MVVHELKQTASWFEANFHVRGTDFFMKQPLLVQQGGKELIPDCHEDNYIMGLTKPIEQNLLNYQGTFMYLKYIIRGESL